LLLDDEATVGMAYVDGSLWRGVSIFAVAMVTSLDAKAEPMVVKGSAFLLLASTQFTNFTCL